MTSAWLFFKAQHSFANTSAYKAGMFTLYLSPPRLGGASFSMPLNAFQPRLFLRSYGPQ